MNEIAKPAVNASCADSIIDSIETEPEKWTACEYHFKRKDRSLSIWIANGPWCVKVEGMRDVLSLWGRWRVWRAYKRWLNGEVARKLNS